VFNEDVTFKPDMSHQIFGDSESIFGYKDLRINLYCTAARMITYVDVKYSDKLTPQRAEGVLPDDILKALNEHLQPGSLTKLDDFISALSKEHHFKPPGDLTHAYSVCRDSSEERQFEIYRSDTTTAGLKDYHERVQPFILFYVDKASYIEYDERWRFFIIFEKYRVDGETMYAFVGYMTVYNYYAYPARIRPRISQVLIMPPFQRHGHAAQLVQCFYNECYARSEVLDIHVEDPSENFQRVRDYIDVRNCLKLPAFNPEMLHRGLTEKMCLEARDKLKLNKKQVRRVYEILRLRATNCFNAAEFKAYRIDVKKRLNAPFQKNGRDFEKLKRALNPSELSSTLNSLTREQRLELLERQFQSCVNDYRLVLNRIDSDC